MSNVRRDHEYNFYALHFNFGEKITFLQKCEAKNNTEKYDDIFYTFETIFQHFR